MALKVYGKLTHDTKKVLGKGNGEVDKPMWFIEKAEPHVSIKLKAIFPQIRKSAIPPYEFEDTPAVCHDLLWFMERYPFEVSDADRKLLGRGKKERISTINEIESLLLPDYKPKDVSLNEGEAARKYQLNGAEVFLKVKRLLLADDLGLGKTLTAILSFLPIQNRPIAVVVQSHLPRQWSDEIKKFTNLTVHIVKTRKAYNLPPADVYIFKYTSLSGWVNLFSEGFFKLACFDECSELRNRDTAKFEASEVLSQHATHAIGLSATPIFNYGNEIYNILNLINPYCLGEEAAFTREWADGYGKKILDPKALGTYLRESVLMLRRTREEVGMELPPVNKIVYTIECDEETMHKDLALAKQLAIKVTSGSFMERGDASRQLDALVRHATGVAKARHVAAFLRILLDDNQRVVVAAWHREVYDILMRELSEYKPVLYTGSESPSQKQKNKEAFVSGDSRVFLLSLRSGIGLDGLQFICNNVVFAELDWSPAVMNQVVGRIDRYGSENQVTAYYLVSDEGSDPVIVDLLALKSSQHHGIVNPLLEVAAQHTDESRIKLLAQQYLNKH